MKNLMLLGVAAAPAVAARTAAQSNASTDLREWPLERGGRTRDPYVAPGGKVWFVGQQGNYGANMDPSSGAVRYYEIEAGTNPHTTSGITTPRPWRSTDGSRTISSLARIRRCSGDGDGVTSSSPSMTSYRLPSSGRRAYSE
jgi:virginiamycin B lyase